jgi:hypothetical protein
MKLPKFLFQYVVKHQTSLGNNLAFPPEQEYPFDYKILKKRMKEVDDIAKEMFGENLNPTKAQNLLVNYLTECQKIEEPIKEQLIKICENVIHKIFSIPRETIELSCELVNSITPKKSMRILPEENDDNDWAFEDLNEISNVNKVVLKRRFINALVQGASYRYAQITDFYIEEFGQLNPTLPQIYQKIIALNDYLLFNKKEKISDKKPKQGGIVEVELGRVGEKTVINAQGTNFIFLLTETIRGFFELFASHGLPEDNKKASYIIRQADFLLAEPWDLRMGVPLWDIITNGVDDTKFMPYYFSILCELPVDEFNENMQEILAKTKRGNDYVSELINDAEKEFEMNNIHQFIQDKNDNETLINDSYFSADELDNEDDEIIEEECFTAEELNEDEDGNGDNEIYKKLLIESSYTDIDFSEEEIDIPTIGQSNKHMWVLNVVINETVIPTDLVYFRAESVYIGGRMFHQLHIHVAPELRQKGIAFKLYQAFIHLFGNAISLFKNRTATFYSDNDSATTNDEAIGKLWNKLAQDSNINVKPIRNKKGEEVGVIAFKK